ncbi:Fic family protein [Burkholderia vietnamiensis]|uniref:Fic family protein n=1 Tax=Burkholderia vietnamiensis TaxID=60552 RepID=UPI001B9965A6|nr:Fic family protein [Burkholderia vietnamiensis]MBR7972959.1 Fic family protein [Burkholderia vietnamiensis]
MIVFELVAENENHPVYQTLTMENGARQYDFLKSAVDAAVALGRPFLSTQVIKALNYHAIACLHAYAGEYRPCQVFVGNHTPPAEYRVQALMDDFVNWVNRNLETADPVALAAFTLWRFNWIHPFINGNGRTARAACYFLLCLKAGGWLSGTVILPELIKRERVRYVAGLQFADSTGGDIRLLHGLLSDLLFEQLNGVPPADGGAWAAAAASLAPNPNAADVGAGAAGIANGDGANGNADAPPAPPAQD